MARPVLELASLLDPTGIPASIFTTAAVTDHLSARLKRSVSSEEVLSALGRLHRFSLLTLNPDQPHHAVRVHALVQRAVLDTIGETLAELAKTAANALEAAWPDIEKDRDLIQALLSNTATLQGVADEHLWNPDGYPVL